MKPKSVPVTMGSARFRSLETAGCLVTEAWFPPDTLLEPHTHSRPVFAVMLHGGFLTTLGRRRLDCVPESAWTEPREDRHANQTGPAGAHVVVVQPDPLRDDLFGLFSRLTHEVHLVRHAMIASDARRLLGEIRTGDRLSSLAADALVLGMMTSASRLMFERRQHARPPQWLLQARDMLHAHFRDGLQLSQIAEAVAVHPSHLAHAFRTYFGVSVGAYARTLRRDWAVELLAKSDLRISEIALCAGYSDQSHFTRDCRKQFGVGPAAYRRLIGQDAREN